MEDTPMDPSMKCQCAGCPNCLPDMNDIGHCAMSDQKCSRLLRAMWESPWYVEAFNGKMYCSGPLWFDKRVYCWDYVQCLESTWTGPTGYAGNTKEIFPWATQVVIYKTAGLGLGGPGTGSSGDNNAIALQSKYQSPPRAHVLLEEQLGAAVERIQVLETEVRRAVERNQVLEAEVKRLTSNGEDLGSASNGKARVRAESWG